MGGLITGIVRDRKGNTLAGATITIYLAGTTTPATLYANETLVTPKTNPLTSDSDGIFIAYAADGRYKWEVARAGLPTETVDNIPALSDPANYAYKAGRAGGQTFYFDTASGAATGKISSTSHATKGKWFLNSAGTITVDEANLRFGVGTAAPSHTWDARVSSSGGAVGRVQNTHASGYSGIEYYDEAGTSKAFMGYDNVLNVGRLNFIDGVSLLTNSVERFSISSAGVGVWNDTGADNDLRMEGDTEANLFFLDASTDRIGMFTATPTVEFHLQKAASAATVEMRVENTAAGVSARSALRATSDSGGLFLACYSSTNTTTRFGQAMAGGAEVFQAVGAGPLAVGTISTGALVFGTGSTERFKIDGTGQGVWNDNGADADLRFEGDTNAGLLFLDAGSDRVEFGGATVASVALSGAVGPFVLVNHGANAGFVVSRATGADINPATLTFWKTRASTPETKTALVDGDVIGRLIFQGAADSSTAHIGASILATVNGTPASSRVPTALSFATATTGADAATVLNMTSAGVMEVPRMHNNGGTAAAAALSSGTYTPTLTGVANVAASTVVNPFNWLRVGNVVSVAGCITVDPTTATTATTLGITVPVASNFVTDSTQCNGFGMCNSPFMAGTIVADITNDRAQYTYICDAGAASQIHRVSFQYVVV